MDGREALVLLGQCGHATDPELCVVRYAVYSDWQRTRARPSAEYRVKTEGRGRTVDEWKIRPEQPDNHWLDCLVGSAVAASIQGVTLFGTEAKAVVRRTRVKLSDLKRERK